jgi:6-phosphofructokinase
LAKEIEEGTKIETRSVVLSHLQRGGAPCAYDRRMGRYFGIAAVDLIVNKNYGNMVCVQNGRISCTPLENIYGRLNLVDPSTQYDSARYNGRRTILNGVKKSVRAQKSQRKV